MQSRHVITRLVLPAVMAVVLIMILYKALAPLPAPIPRQGQIVDAITGKPVAGAELTTSWQVYDYPMLDGAGSYELSSVTVTNDDGCFCLVIPDHRRGIWNTETYPPIIRAAGYKPFTSDDMKAVTYVDGQSVIIKLTPE